MKRREEHLRSIYAIAAAVLPFIPPVYRVKKRFNSLRIWFLLIGS